MPATAIRSIRARTNATPDNRPVGRPIEDPHAPLWEQYVKTRSRQLRDRLTELYAPEAERIARQMQRRLPRQVQLDELVSAGLFGLLRAIETFDPSRCVQFRTFCTPRVRGAILDYLRECDDVSRQARNQYNAVAAASDALRQELGRSPTDEELLAHMDCSAAQLARTMRGATRPVSLSRDRSGNEGLKQLLEIDTLVVDGGDQLRRMQREDLKRVLTQHLSRANRLILVLYYYEGLTMAEIGAVLDLTESRVSQRLHETLDLLRSSLAGRERELAEIIQ